MSDISAWDASASANNNAAPDGFPEGMAPSGVNDAAREVMAAVRRFYDSVEWRDLGHTITYVSATSFKISGTDVSADYPVGRRVHANGSSTGDIYGTVTVVAFSTDTTVTVVWDAGALSNEALTVEVGLSPTNTPLPGDLVQTVSAADATYQSTTDTIPVDDSIPQNTEGSEIETVAITPTHASNLLMIEADVPVHITASSTAAIALFQDSTAGALAASWLGPDGSHNGNLRLVHTMAAGTTSETTFKIRVGVTNGSLIMNGNASNRIFGGVMATRLRVTEVKRSA